MALHVALWDFPPGDCVEAAARALGWVVERRSGAECIQLAQDGQVDIALAPTVDVLALPDALEVVPGGAMSAKSYPWACLHMKRGLGHARSAHVETAPAQEQLMTRIILKEHYGLMPMAGGRSKSDIELIIGTDALALETDPLALDLGREWYELANYPMVWGLYACASTKGTPAMVLDITSLTHEAERMASDWESERSPAVGRFFSDDLQLRLDDVALASLTQISEYLFYYNEVSELSPVRLYEPPAADPDENTPWWATESVKR